MERTAAPVPTGGPLPTATEDDMTYGNGTPGPQGADATPPGLPRWVKVGAIVVGLLVLVVLVLQLTGVAGDHGPGMHSSAGSSPANAAADRLAAAG